MSHNANDFARRDVERDASERPSRTKASRQALKPQGRYGGIAQWVVWSAGQSYRGMLKPTVEISPMPL